MNKVYKFNDNESEGCFYLVIDKINAYGVAPHNFDRETNMAKEGTIWVDVGDAKKYTRRLSYKHAMTIMDEMTNAILSLKESNNE